MRNFRGSRSHDPKIMERFGLEEGAGGSSIDGFNKIGRDRAQKNAVEQRNYLIRKTDARFSTT